MIRLPQQRPTQHRFHPLFKPAAALIALGIVANAGAASLTASGYYQDFSSLGTGTSLATNTPEWSYWSESGEHDWGNGGVVPAAPSGSTPGVSSMTQVNQSTTAMKVESGNTLPTGPSVNGYNVALTAVTPSAPAASRVIATSPTGDAGVAWQLTLTNSTGAALTGIDISYDIAELAAANSSGTVITELAPGYQLFYSTDGSTWTNVAALNPQPTNASGPVVPNSVGVTPVGLYDLTFASAVANGSSFSLRWVDPNNTVGADQVIGLTDVSVTPVPLPAGLPLLVAALGGLSLLRRRNSVA